MRLDHYKKLQNMYLSAPLHQFYDTLEISVNEGKCEIELEIESKYFHAGGSGHGSVFFKLLDDASFFSIQSILEDYFIVTKSFEIELKRPMLKGKVKAIGKVVSLENDKMIAYAVLINEFGKTLAEGKGEFVQSRMQLKEVNSYK